MGRNAAQRVRLTSPGPWLRWRGSRHGRAIRFIQTYCRAERGVGYGKPLHLFTWEKEFIEAYYARGVTAGGTVMGRGGGKSTLMAGLATFNTFEDNPMGAPVVPIVAASLAQSKSAIYSQVVSMVGSEPELEGRSLMFSGIGTERIIVPRTGGAVFPRSADPDTLQGLDITDGYVDEWGHLSTETWNAILMGRKRPGSRVLGAGTPGPDIESPLYLIRRLVREGNAPESFYYREFSGLPGAPLRDERNWRRANPSLRWGMPDIAFLRNAVVMTPEAAFRTYHLAEFDVIGHESWLGPDARRLWQSLTDVYDLVPGAPTYVGVDIGLIRDATAIVCVQRREDGRLHARAKVWQPAPGDTVDISEVVQYIRNLASTYKVAEVAYDPRLFELPAQMLADERIPMVEIPQSLERMTPIVGALFELIHRGGLSHDDDKVFADHVISAVPRLNDRGYTLSKVKSSGHIDACIALALAVDRAQHPKKMRAPLVLL